MANTTIPAKRTMLLLTVINIAVRIITRRNYIAFRWGGNNEEGRPEAFSMVNVNDPEKAITIQTYNDEPALVYLESDNSAIITTSKKEAYEFIIDVLENDWENFPI